MKLAGWVFDKPIYWTDTWEIGGHGPDSQKERIPILHLAKLITQKATLASSQHSLSWQGTTVPQLPHWCPL